MRLMEQVIERPNWEACAFDVGPIERFDDDDDGDVWTTRLKPEDDARTLLWHSRLHSVDFKFALIAAVGIASGFTILPTLENFYKRALEAEKHGFDYKNFIPGAMTLENLILEERDEIEKNATPMYFLRKFSKLLEGKGK